MKLSAVLVPAALAASVVAEPTPGWMPSQVTISEDYKVPGDNPLYFCADPKDYIVEIDKVDLSPNPPEAYVARPLGLVPRSSSSMLQAELSVPHILALLEDDMLIPR